MTQYTATICIEGTKGAGKSTTIRTLVTRLEAEGWFVAVCAPFAEGNIRARKMGWSGISEMAESGWADNLRAVSLLTEIMDDARSRFETDRAASVKSRGLLIYDRGLMTLHTYCFDLGFADSRYGRAAGEAFWQENFPKYLDPAFFIHTRPDISYERRRSQLGAACGLRTLADLERDYAKRCGLIQDAPFAQCLVGSFETGRETFRDCAGEIAACLPSLLRPVVSQAPLPAPKRRRKGVAAALERAAAT